MSCGIVYFAPRRETSFPTSYHHDTLCKHCERANYQGAIWRRSLQSCPRIPLPNDHGWKLQDDYLIIHWMSGEPAPLAVLELLSCQCKRNYQLPSCSCHSNGLQCTDLCRLQECSNWHREPTEIITETDDEEEEKIYQELYKYCKKTLQTKVYRNENIF